MSNHKKLVDYCKGKDPNARFISTPDVLIDLTGDVESAVFLNQIVFWSDKGLKKDGWFYKTYVDWKKELGYGKSKLNRIRDNLEKKGYIQTENHLINGGKKVLHWKANFDVIYKDLDELYEKKNILINKKQQEETPEKAQSDSAKSNISDLNKTSKSENPIKVESLKEKKKKLKEEINIDRKIERMCLDESLYDSSFIAMANITNESKFRITVHNYLLDEILGITKEEYLDKVAKDKLLEIAVNLNFSQNDLDDWDPNKPCIAFIVKIINWAKNKVEQGESFSPNNILNAILNPDNLSSFRKKNSSDNPHYSRNESNMDYAFFETLFDSLT